MPPKKCSMKVPPAQREVNWKCLKKGIAVGMNMRRKITMQLSKDVLRDIARTNKVVGYSNMTKEQLYNSLLAKGVTTYAPI